MESVPSLDIAEYRETYEQVSWHWLLIGVKTSMAVHSKKEATIEFGRLKTFALEQQNKYSWMAYRSTSICKKSFDLMDRYVGDPRIRPIIDECQELLDQIDKNIIITI